MKKHLLKAFVLCLINCLLIGISIANTENYKHAIIKELNENYITHSLEQALKAPVDDVKVLDLSNKELKKVPVTVQRFRKLKCLILSNNNISKLPAYFKYFKHLEYLFLDSNALTSKSILVLKPTTKLQFRNLQCLYLSHNSLDSTINSRIFLIPKLRLLNLSNNSIHHIDSLKKLLAIEILDLHNTGLDTIPDIKSQTLKQLYLNNNNLQYSSLRQLEHTPNIELLDLSKNSLDSLDQTVGSLKNLKFLNLAHNNLKILSQEIYSGLKI